jgi:hypothetical protein
LGWEQSKPLLQQVTLASVLVIWGEASCITSKDVSTENEQSVAFCLFTQEHIVDMLTMQYTCSTKKLKSHNSIYSLRTLEIST